MEMEDRSTNMRPENRILGSGMLQNSMDPTEEEIDIYFNVFQKVPFRVKRSETVKNLKAMLREVYGYESESSLKLLFNGTALKDTQALVDYGIKKDSFLHIHAQSFKRIHIFVKLISDHEAIVVEARKFDTIKNFKMLISDTIKNIKTISHTSGVIQPDDFTLIYDGKLLDGDSTILASLKVQSGSTFYLILTSKEVLSIYVKAPNNHAVKLKVEGLFTVNDIKAMVESITGMSMSGCYIAFAGKKLQDCLTLASYDIKEGAMLYILPLRFQIFVKICSGNTITLDVDQFYTIKSVKLKFLQKMNVSNPSPPLSFVFAGRQLDDGWNLASYNIQKDSTLHAYVPLKNDFYPAKCEVIHPGEDASLVNKNDSVNRFDAHYSVRDSCLWDASEKRYTSDSESGDTGPSQLKNEFIRLRTIYVTLSQWLHVLEENIGGLKKKVVASMLLCCFSMLLILLTLLLK